MKYIRTFLFVVFSLAQCAAAIAAPVILTPLDGSTLSGSSETFTWSGEGTVVDKWRLEVGTVPDGRDLYGKTLDSTITSMVVSGLPTDGSPVYVKLKWKIDGAVSAASYVYTAADDSVPPNIAPVVDAGADQTITLPVDSVTLSGTVSDDGLPDGTLDITWSLFSGPAAVTFGDSTLAATTATFTAAGDYILRLTGTDGVASTSDDVLITVLAEPDTELPVVTITAPAAAAIVNGSVAVAATATDNVSVTEVEFFAAGSSIGIDSTSPYSAIWDSTVEIDADYDITAIARDASGNEGGDSVVVTLDNGAAVNQPPTVDAGANVDITLPTDTTGIIGTASDDGLPSASLTTTWTATNPPFAVTFVDATALATDVTFGGAGTYILRLTADDGDLSASADVTITVNPEPAGEQTFVATGDNVINGAQPNRAIGGGANIQVHSFGPKVGLVQFDLSTLSGATISSASFRLRLNNLKSGGNIDLQLLDEAWSEATVTYDNQPAFGATVLSVPVTSADIGTVISVDVTSVVQSWADGSQPSHGFRLETNSGINASIDSRESAGTPMELLVTSGVGTGNVAPQVAAGSDQTITLPVDSVTLSGTVSDDGLPDGTLDITWSLFSGPAAVTFGDSTLAATTATFTAAGDYILRLTGTDGVASTSDDVLITVLAEPDTELPVVTITAPAAAAIVNGSVAVAATATDNVSVTEVEFFAAGSSIGIDSTSPYSAIWDSTVEIDADYDITAIARDASGNEGGDSVVVTLDNGAAVNQPPTVDAGANVDITLPTDTTGIIGTASDDGLPSASLTTTWTATNPPFAVTFVDATALATDVTFGGAGTYILRLTADDGDLSASADVTITVNPEPAGEQTFVATGDNVINGAQPNRAIGGGANIQVHSFGPKVGLVQFDLSTLSGATISSASFRLRLNNLKSGGNIDLQLLDEAWSEATVTYDNQPAFGATVLSVPVTSADIGTVISVDVTSIVQSWADGSQPSHGFRLETNSGINASIDSRESAGTPMELLVTFDSGTPIVATPSISPNGATSTTPVEVSLATTTPGASIYYTLDGSTPTTASNFYSAPFTLTVSATVKARAFAAGFNDSVVSSAVFTIDATTGGGLNNYWTLNETAAGNYANDGGGAAGSCASCPTPGGGLIDGGQSFDGISNVITVAGDGSTDWTQNGGFSVEFWLNKSSACSTREVVVGRFDGSTAMQWAVGCDGGSPFFELADANGPSVTVTGTGAIDDGEWHHVVAVYDGFFKENRLYMDGKLEASGAAVYTAGFGSAAEVTIGELQNSLGNTFLHGIVDEVALHDRTIPASVIDRHYQDGAIGLRDGYVGCTAAVDVMPLGDSITNRLGYRSTLYFDLTGQGYDVNFVGSNSDATGAHDRDHEGWSGFATTDIAANLNGWLSGNPPEVVLLHAGTNDIGAVSVAEAITGLTSILDIIQLFNPEITVVLGQIINQQTFSQDVVDYNDQMATLAQTKLAAGHKILLVDHENALIYPDDMEDLEHPNDAGFAKMAGVWFNGMTEFLPVCNVAAPIFKSVASTSGQVATEYRYQPNVLANPDGTFTLLTMPAGMQVHPDTGEVRWTPGAAGQYNVDLQLQNSAGSSVQSFILNIP